MGYAHARVFTRLFAFLSGVSESVLRRCLAVYVIILTLVSRLVKSRIWFVCPMAIVTVLLVLGRSVLGRDERSPAALHLHSAARGDETDDERWTGARTFKLVFNACGAKGRGAMRPMFHPAFAS